MIATSSDIFKKEGVRGFYRGLDSALVRQIFYTTTRMGIYKTISEEKGYCASIAGFIGALFANPADLALVRMQADNQLPVAERRNYKNVFDAFRQIAKEDGVAGLWRGARLQSLEQSCSTWQCLPVTTKLRKKCSIILEQSRKH
ncbi:mitochondrial dicarboxylate/tricarboxylate transporter DTC [Nymphaea colorata]|uniref:mitochondrial dicarboxylate/tricarboxylate transporter DTC n=1 Tax=Nymphaea colorata TaxID=210225 RepID=UPI00129EDDF3|nr:mitochondrial dicarboxylate/tricarboxylate transporter DTC [Nymphaea colorata]